MAVFFVGVIYADRELLDDLESVFSMKFGELKEGVDYDFSKFTDYYEGQMGKKLRKRFYVFGDEEEIKEVKGSLILRIFKYVLNH